MEMRLIAIFINFYCFVELMIQGFKIISGKKKTDKHNSPQIQNDSSYGRFSLYYHIYIHSKEKVFFHLWLMRQLTL